MVRGILQESLLDMEQNVTTIQEQLKRRDPRINKTAFVFSGQETETKSNNKESVVTSEYGIVAADHENCSEIGAEVLGRLGGTAVDAAVAVAFCLGVMNLHSSGIGGGALMVLASSSGSVAMAYDMRATAPLAASQDMFKNREAEKVKGPLSIAVPGEIAGLYKAWETHGRVQWKLLVEPAIKLARDGFEVGSHLAFAISKNEDMIKNDIGLKSVFTKGDKFLKKGDICYNPKLAETLEIVAEKGMKAFYEEDVAEKLVSDVREAGGIMTMEDLRSYEVKVSDAMVVDDVMGYKIQGMWPPACGTTGFAMVMNVLKKYKKVKDTDENLCLHRVIEAMKHMLAARMDLADPAFVNGTYNVVENLLSKSYAERIQKKISDYTTFPPEYYLNKYNQLENQGTSHFCVVDKDRNTVSMTTTVNYWFGSGFMSPSTGILLNGQMEDFSIPTEGSPNSLPPAPANYIAPKKRPLSSMMPLIITKDTELVGVIGASGGPYIFPAVIQVFLNHFIFKMSPLEAVQSPRVYPKLKLNEVWYEDMKVFNGDHIKLKEETQEFLKMRRHKLVMIQEGGIVQLVVQNRIDDSKTLLTAVSDIRKDGKPAAASASPTLAHAPLI
ncbi:unnamed protein product [Arabis nemorensis]|uniref:Glutathione hydrolase n=1 Tax=Arabis nemorensis TaxID=586526 RepID=A0A565CBZ4_9BRAS|nr:unnamed protein product [Arabis nemorensis]